MDQIAGADTKRSSLTPQPRERNDPESCEESASDENTYPADDFSTPRHILFIGTMCGAMLSNQAALGNTLAIVDVIGESFGMTNQGELSWLIAGYSLTIGTFILIGGRLGDEFGNKKLFLIGMAWFSFWSLIAGLAVYSTHVLFVFARVFQGIGPALTMPNSLAILGKSYSPGPRKNMAFAWFAGSAAFGFMTGMLFGGLFALLWWPWVYWSQAIALTAVTVFAAWTVPSVPGQLKKTRSMKELIEDLDISGGLTGVITLVLFNFAWNQAVVVGWEQPYVYVCLILGALFCGAFFYIEVYWAKSPIVPLAVFNTDIAFVFACTAAGWSCFGIWIYYIVRVAMRLDENTPLQMAAWFSPVIPSGLIAALAVGKMLGRIHASYIMLAGQAACVIATLLAATRPVNSTYWSHFFLTVLFMPIAMDTSLPAASIIFSDAVPRKYQGMGASLVMTIVNYSTSLGLGFAGTLETHVNHAGKTKSDELFGYRAALWLGVGLAGLGLGLSFIFVGRSKWGNDKLAKTTNNA